LQFRRIKTKEFTITTSNFGEAILDTVNVLNVVVDSTNILCIVYEKIKGLFINLQLQPQINKTFSGYLYYFNP
jgi:hypothetical protein